MKPLHALGASTLMLLALPMPALAGAGMPVLGEEHVDAQMHIIGAGVDVTTYYLQLPPYDTSTTATPLVMTLGSSNAVHGGPSNPVAGGLLTPGTLDASNALVPANAPLNLLDPAAAASWDRRSFAYAMGNGPSFSVGVAVGEWGQQAYAQYRYTFQHTNVSGLTESISSVTSHVDAGRLFLLVPNRVEHQDFTLTNLQVAFNYDFNVLVVPDDPARGGQRYGAASLSKTRGSTFGDLSFPPGYHELGAGIAGQAIPAQTLTISPFDLAPGEQVYVSVNLGVFALIEGSGIAPPILYVVAGDPVALTAGTATPSFTMTYAPAAEVPEPQRWVLLLGGLALCLLRWRPAAPRADGSPSVGCTGLSSHLTRTST